MEPSCGRRLPAAEAPASSRRDTRRATAKSRLGRSGRQVLHRGSGLGTWEAAGGPSCGFPRARNSLVSTMSQALPSATLGFGQFFGDSEFRRELSGFTLARIVASRPSHEVPDHTHETAHLVLVLEGDYVTTAERMEAGRKPSLVWNPPATLHRDRFVDNLGTFFTVSISDPRLATVGSGKLPARPVGISSGPVLRIARRLVRTFESWPRRSTARAEELCHELLTGLFQENLPRPRAPRWLNAVRETLERRYDESLRISDLAADAGVHPVHLIRSFQRFFGCTPGQFLRKRRLEAAAALLRTSDLPTVEIALLTG